MKILETKQPLGNPRGVKAILKISIFLWFILLFLGPILRSPCTFAVNSFTFFYNQLHFKQLSLIFVVQLLFYETGDIYGIYNHFDNSAHGNQN